MASAAGTVLVVCSPTCQLFDLLVFRLVGLSGSWRGKPEALGSALQGLASCRWCRQRVGGAGDCIVQ